MGTDEALERMEELRKRSSAELNRFFDELLKEKTQVALDALNDERCSFTTFFLLIPKIRIGMTGKRLSERNQCALSLYENKRSNIPCFPEDDPAIRDALKWILTTGRDLDGLSALYDELLDAAVIKLIMIFREASVIHDAVSLCFQRNRKDAFHHDLVWALFHAYRIEPLAEIAENLLSSDERDVRFACSLLYLEPPRNMRDETEKKMVHDAFLSWLEENGEYLYFTGDSFQRTGEPVFFALNAPAKYVGRPVSKKTGFPLGTLSEHERTVMDFFGRSNPDEKKRLLAYSDRLKKTDPASWKNYLSLAFADQRSAALGGMEGLV